MTMEQMSQYYKIYANFKNAINDLDTHHFMTEALKESDNGKDSHNGKAYYRVVDLDWVEAIEDTLQYIDKAIRENRRFIEVSEEVVPIEKARNITTESVKHLAQHTNLIARVEGDEVTPEKILNIQRDESFAIYENRFIHTLLQKLAYFVGLRYKALNDAPTDSYSKIDLHRSFSVDEEKVDYDLTLAVESHAQTKVDLQADVSTLTDLQRVNRIRTILADFMSTPLMRELNGCEPVRPPILHTNLMTKNPNFKKSLDLWLYIETYKKPGYQVMGDEYTGELDNNYKIAIYDTFALQKFAVELCANRGLEKKLRKEYQDELKQQEEERQKKLEEQRRLIEQRIEEARREEIEKQVENIRVRDEKIAELTAANEKLASDLQYREQLIKELRQKIYANEEEIRRNKEYINSLEISVKERDDQIRFQKERMNKLESTIAAQQNEIIELKAKVEEAELAVAELTAKTEELEAEIAKLESIIDENEARISRLELEIEEKNAAIDSLNADLDSKKAIIAKLEATVKENETKIAAQEESIAGLKSDIVSAQQKHAAEIAGLNEQNEQKIAEIKSGYENKLSGLQADYDKLDGKYESKLAKIEEKRSKELQRIESKRESELNRIETKRESELNRIETKRVAEVDKIEAKRVKELERVRKEEASAYDKKLREASKRFKSHADKMIASAKSVANNTAEVAVIKANGKIAVSRNIIKLENGLSLDEYREFIRTACTISKGAPSGKVKIFVDSLCGVSETQLESAGVSVIQFSSDEDSKFEMSVKPIDMLKAMKPYIESGDSVIYAASSEKKTGAVSTAELVSKESGFHISASDCSNIYLSSAPKALGTAVLAAEGVPFDELVKAELTEFTFRQKGETCLIGQFTGSKFRKIEKIKDDFKDCADKYLSGLNKSFAAVSANALSSDEIKKAKNYLTESGFKNIFVLNSSDNGKSKSLDIYCFK